MLHVNRRFFAALMLAASSACAPDGPGGPSNDETAVTVADNPLYIQGNCADTLALILNTSSDPGSILSSELSAFVANFNQKVRGNPALSVSDRNQLHYAKLYHDSVPSGINRLNMHVSRGADADLAPFGSFDGWCGNSGPQIWRCDSGTSGATPFPSAVKTIYHEVFQNLGINETWDTEPTENCAMHPANPIPSGADPCEHDKQFYYRYCGLRGTGAYATPDITVALSSPSIEILGPSQIPLNDLESYQARANGTATSMYWSKSGPINLSGSNPATSRNATGTAVGDGTISAELRRTDVRYPWPKETKPVDVYDPDAVAYVVVSPSWITLTDDSGQTLYVQASATAYTASDQPLSKTFSWSIDNTNVAIVYGQGNIEGRRTGITTVRASVDGVTGTATVDVRCGKPAGTECIQWE